MSLFERKEITADDVRSAGEVLDQILERAAEGKATTPALEQIAAARREPDRMTRTELMAKALQQGARDARAAQQRLKQMQQEQAKMSDADGVDFTPEALEELQALKDSLKRKIRKRAEEEMARACPEVANPRKIRPPRRNRLTI